MLPSNMLASAVLALLLVLLGLASSRDSCGRSVTLLKAQKGPSGLLEVPFIFRENGRDSCGDVEIFGSSKSVPTDQDNAGRNKWCQSEGQGTLTAQNAEILTLSETGCCWGANEEGLRNWTAQATMDLGRRSDTGVINQPPVTATVASFRLPQNCFTNLPLLAYDPDKDHVRCRLTSNVSPTITMDEDQCVLETSGSPGLGVHAFELVLEDYPRRNVTLSHADGTSSVKKAFNVSSSDNSSPFSRVPLQFALEILPPVANCVPGQGKPQFLSGTASHGALKHAVLGQEFQLHVEAQATQANIYNIQVSGPLNMTKEFKLKESGKAQAILSWTPASRDLHRNVPLCFTAETNESQSEMRCVVIAVARTPALEGNGEVKCSTNQMTVVLEKASMPGINKTWLHLADPSCSLTSNSTHIMGSMSLSTCGTTMEDKGDFIVFKNEINSFELATEVITRRRKVKIGFACQFPKTMSISSIYQLYRSEYIFTESNFGSFGYAFDFFKDATFAKKMGAEAYPMEIKVMDMMYMGIQAKSDLPKVTLFVESCKATPDENPENSHFYYLIQNGCVKDETLKVYSSDPSTFDFEIQAFKFTGDFEQVYITCSVILCETGSPHSRCSEGCVKDAPRRRKRGLARETASHSIMQGPVRVLRQTSAEPGADGVKDVRSTKGPSGAEGAGLLKSLSTNISTIVFASLFILTVVFLLVVVVYFAKKSKVDNQSAPLVSDWD